MRSLLLQIFGLDISDVTICESMLIVRHRSLVTKYYDFDKLIQSVLRYCIRQVPLILLITFHVLFS